ncbi:toxin VasX, partial [Pseudomonas sp. HMSC75E02]|uniref:toxin VasX n=1 Tax=Pseudomonas sp. HMSC75E02 TaxID=1608908 RepID=UPI003001B79C
ERFMISNPNRLHGMSHDDARNPIASCPARQNELYVVPARYALAEHPARHASLQPAVRASSHPMALRRLRGGFLYLWHAQGPLQRYAVAADGLLQSQPLTADESVLLHGSQAGFALDKRHDAWLLYSEIPLGA